MKQDSRKRQLRTSNLMERLSAMQRSEFVDLKQLPNVGRATAADLQLIGVDHPSELIGRDAYSLYDALCQATQQRHDPCVIDVFLSIVRFMDGEPARPWWEYSAERKAELEIRNANPRSVK